MMNLPLLMAAPTASSVGRVGGRDVGTSPQGDGAGFEATLTALLGDAGKEVAEMVETLGQLADLDREHDELAAIGWPMPALLALTAQGGADHAAMLEELEAGLGIGLDGPQGGGDIEGAGAGPVDETSETTDVTTEGEDDTTPGAARTLPTGTPGDAAPTETSEIGAAEGDDRAEEDGSHAPRVPATTQSDGQAMSTTTATAGPATIAAGAADVTDHLDVDEQAATRPPQGSRAVDPDQTPGAVRDSATDRGGSLRVDAAGDRVPTAGEPLAARPDAARPTPNAGMSSAIQRVMEAVDRLATLPPPQRLTVDLGEVRIRVSVEDGQVRLAVLDGDADVGDELLQDARDELAQRGFDLGADGDDTPRAGFPAEDTSDDQPQRPSTRERVATGLRL